MVLIFPMIVIDPCGFITPDGRHCSNALMTLILILPMAVTGPTTVTDPRGSNILGDSDGP